MVNNTFQLKNFLFLVSPCDNNPCENNGTCSVDVNGNATCICDGNWNGTYCQGILKSYLLEERWLTFGVLNHYPRHTLLTYILM